MAVDGQKIPIPTRDRGVPKPDIFLWGKGSSAFPPVQGTPPPSINVEIHHKARESRRKGRPSIGPGASSRSRLRAGHENISALSQLGTYVREIFTAQENSRFVHSLILTECTVEFLLWDRAGVVVSERLDYHTDALLICHMLKCLVTWDDHQLGFDPNVF